LIRAQDWRPKVEEKAMKDQSKMDQNLARENAKWRTSYRAAQAELSSAEATIATLTSKIAGYESPGATSGRIQAPAAGEGAGDDLPGSTAEHSSVAAGEQPDDPEYAELLALRNQLRNKAVHQSLEAAGALYPAESMAILESRGQLSTNDDTGEISILVDGQPEPISSGAIEKVLRPEFLKAQGVRGSGARGGSRIPAADIGVMDPSWLARCLRDPAYKARAMADARRRNGQ
jgi:hypothetical protein